MNINEILSDFRRRYEHSYIFVAPPDSEEESLFFVNRITEDRKNLATLELQSPEYGKIILNMGTAHTLRFKYPPVGVFQNGQDAYLFRRVPAKQYKHGLYHGNSSVSPVYNAIIGKPMREQHEQLNFDDVLAAYQAQQHTFGDALKMLQSGKFRSVALRRNFSLVLTPNTSSTGYVLLYWETPIALMDTEGKVVMMYEKSYETVIEQVKGA